MVKEDTKKSRHTKSYFKINMLRGFLVLSILWHHLQPVPLKIMDIDVFFLISFPGRIIVWLFFVISGYSIYYGYMNEKYDLNVKDTLRFYYNRAIRILPLFYLTIFISWIFFLYISPQDLPSWQSILRTMFFMDFNLYKGINTFTPAWFVGIVIYFYLFAPILVAGYTFMYKRTNLMMLSIVLIALAYICHYFGHWCSGTYDIRNFAGCLPFFLFGFFAYSLNNDAQRILQKIFKYISIRISFLIMLILFEYAFYYYVYKTGNFFMKPIEGFIGLGGCVLIVLLLQNDASSKSYQSQIVSFLKSFSSSLFEKLGQQAYGFYLWHGIVILIFSKMFLFNMKGPPFSSFFERLKFFGVTAITSYLVSIIFYNLLERPFHGLYITNHKV